MSDASVYNGFEIDMLSLGNADSILVTKWTDSIATRVLIDGGNSSTPAKLWTLLNEIQTAHIDHIVCTHPHDDHALGLIEILKNKHLSVGNFWMHIPRNHINLVQLHATLGLTTAKKAAKIIQESLETAQEVESVATSRGLIVQEPFEGKKVGFLQVLGPTVEYYEELLSGFKDLQKLQVYEEALEKHQSFVFNEEILESVSGKRLAASDILGGADTEPENNSSVVLGTLHDKRALLFTSDAGVPALEKVATSYSGLQNCRWMQIPHHGSRRNINKLLIDFLKPDIAFVSAGGTKKHPRIQVVNAFKEVGTRVYSTHYPDGGNLRMPYGNVPPRAGTIPATPLYEKKTSP